MQCWPVRSRALQQHWLGQAWAGPSCMLLYQQARGLPVAVSCPIKGGHCLPDPAMERRIFEVLIVATLFCAVLQKEHSCDSEELPDLDRYRVLADSPGIKVRLPQAVKSFLRQLRRV